MAEWNGDADDQRELIWVEESVLISLEFHGLNKASRICCRYGPGWGKHCCQYVAGRGKHCYRYVAGSPLGESSGRPELPSPGFCSGDSIFGYRDGPR